MRIAYVSSVYPSVSQRFIVREVNALRARGVEIGLFSIRRALPSEVVGPEAQGDAAETTWLIPPRVAAVVASFVWAVTTRPIRLIQTFARAVGGRRMLLAERLRWIAYFIEAVLLARHLVRGRFEHLHCHFGNAGSSAAMLAAHIAGLSFSITCHGSELRDVQRQRLPTKVKHASFVACVSHFGRAQLLLGCPPRDWGKLHVVRCGVSDNPPRSPSAGTPELLCVGRLSPEKGHLVLLEALGELHREGLDVHCTLVGDGPMRLAIEAAIQRFNLTSVVRLTGSLDPLAVDRLYDAAGAVVLASFSEGVPVVLMEAMSRGLPVVATSVGGIPELVHDGVNGLLVPPGDAAALRDALARLLRDPRFARTLGEKGIERVREEFDLDRAVDRLLKLFEQACPARHAMPATSTKTVCLAQAKTADS